VAERLIAVLIALAVSLPASADQLAVRSLVDASCPADMRDYAIATNDLFAVWVPKINEILYGADHKPPFEDILIVFEPGIRVPAFASRNQIHADCAYIKVMKDDYRGMLVHEVTHVVQSYPTGQTGAGWVVEGIADYIRHKYFEKDISATLRLDGEGRLYGYGDAEPYFQSLQKNHVDLSDKGYLKSYTVASTFLFWLESNKNPRIVRELNLALSQDRYSPERFQQLCGTPLDALWAEFVKAR
jgi:hypothetical protein